MAGLFFDSFDHYATAELLQKWTTSFTDPAGTIGISASNGRRSTQSLRATVTAGGTEAETVQIAPASVSGATCVVGFSFKTSGLSQLGAGTSPDPNDTSATPTSGILYIREGTTTHVFFTLTTSGNIAAYRGSGTTGVLLGTSSWALSAGTTYYLEFKVAINDTTGTVEVRRDGSAGITLTGQDTQNGGTSTWTSIAVGHLSVTTNVTYTWDYDDLYLLDGSGSVNNNFLGDVRIDATYPNAEGTNDTWTPATGTDNYAMVDEALTDGDTTYNSTATATNKDTLNFPNAPVTGATIHSIQVNIAARKTDAGAAGIKAIARISATDNLGSEMSVASSYSILRQVWDQTPEGSPQTWTDTIYNATEFGYQKST